MEKTLFIFIDESGNFDFSPVGSRYFLLTCLSTFKPTRESTKFISLRYDLLREGFDQESFHATEDSQIIRDKVYSVIESLSNDIEIHSVIAQKNKANPSLYTELYKKRGEWTTRKTEAAFYEMICKMLLQYVFRRSDFKKTDKIIVVLGAIFTSKKQSLILQTLKKYLKERFSKPFEIYFHQSRADINCQIADYCGWALYVRWSRNEQRPFSLIKDKVKSQFEIFKRGETEYY